MCFQKLSELSEIFLLLIQTYVRNLKQIIRKACQLLLVSKRHFIRSSHAQEWDFIGKAATRKRRKKENLRPLTAVSVVVNWSFATEISLLIYFIRRRTRRKTRWDEKRINTRIFHFSQSYLEIFICLIYLCFIYMFCCDYLARFDCVPKHKNTVDVRIK